MPRGRLTAKKEPNLATRPNYEGEISKERCGVNSVLNRRTKNHGSAAYE